MTALPPQHEQTSNDKETRHGAKILAAMRCVRMRSSIVCFQIINTLIKLCVGAGCRVCFCLSLLNLTQPWDFLNTLLGSIFCRIDGLDLPTSSSARRGENPSYITRYQVYNMIYTFIVRIQVFSCLTVCDHRICISLGLRRRTDTGCTADDVG